VAYIDRDGVKIYYDVDGTGPAVLLSHGYSASARMWRGQVEALKDSYRVITWDMRGHAESDSPADQSLYSEDATVEDMAAILRECGASKAVIGGLSLGGYMSLAFYAAHPEMVQALMLFDTGPGYRNPKAREGWNETSYRRAKAFEERGLEAVGRSAEVQVSVHRSAEGLAKAARGMLAQFDSRVMDVLEKVAVPTMVLVGSEDQPFLAATDYMAAKIPGAQRVVIEGAGHASNIDKPVEFNEAVRKFLGGLELS
jgi:pimeloyl-ACP methyl ester carboxylesterase